MTRAIAAFIGIAYLLSAAIGVGSWLTGAHALVFAAMLMPALAAWMVGHLTGERLSVTWSRLPLRYLPLALFLIPVLMHAAMLPATSALEGELPWQQWLTPDQNGRYHAPPERGWGTLSEKGLAARIVLNALFGVIAVSFLAMFEEIGWRGWLLPRLTSVMGARRAIVATSAIWGLWHSPFGLSGLDETPSLDEIASATIAWPMGVFVFGLIIGWLWVRTESIWIVTFAHGALNNWGQYAFKYMRDFSIADQGQVLLAGLVSVLVVGIGLLTFAMPAARPGAERPPGMNGRAGPVT